MGSVIGLALKPLVWGSRIGVATIYSGLELLQLALSLHLLILWRLAISSIALFALPIRALTALYTQSLLESKLDRLRIEMEELLWDRKELEEQLHLAMGERRMLEMMLTELEAEHDEAILQVQLLQGQVQDLKNEMQRLKCKALWRLDNDDDVVLTEEREVALSRSLFSATLSFVVGIVVWESKDPCLPLLLALFTVITMSLTSTLRFFTRIQHKPAFQSVTLLTINCFLLGTLVYPMLPTLARFFAPLALRCMQLTFKWFGLHSNPV